MASASAPKAEPRPIPLVVTFDLGSDEEITGVTWRDARRVVATTKTQLVVLDVEEGRVVSREARETEAARSPHKPIEWPSPDGRLVAIDALHGLEVRVPATGRLVVRIPPWGGYAHPTEPIGPVAQGIEWSPTGDRAVVSTDLFTHSLGNIRRARLYDTRTWRIVKAEVGGTGVSASMSDRAYFFSHDGRTLFAVSPSGRFVVEVIDAASGRGLGGYGLFGNAYAVDFGPGRLSPDGRMLADPTRPSLVIRDAITGAVRARFDGGGERTIEDVAFDADGSELRAMVGGHAPDSIAWGLGEAPRGPGADAFDPSAPNRPDSRAKVSVQHECTQPTRDDDTTYCHQEIRVGLLNDVAYPGELRDLPRPTLRGARPAPRGSGARVRRRRSAPRVGPHRLGSDDRAR